MWNGVIGKHSEGVDNDSGRRTLRFSAEYCLNYYI